MDTETTETVETEETETDAVDASEEVETEEVVEDPTAGLKTALQKERAARKAAEKRSKELEQERADREKSADEKRSKELEQERADREKSADEKALDDARRDAAAEATAKANKRLIAAEFRSAAAKRVKDPRIAAKLVDLDGIEVDDDGEVDADGIAAALDAVLEEYPDLAPSRFEGTADQGARGKAAAPSQLTRDDLKNMTPQAILKAEKEGRLDRLKGKTK